MFKTIAFLWASVFIALSTLAVSFLMPMHEVFATPSCPLSSQTGRTVVVFDGSTLVSDGSGLDKTSAILTSPIPTGAYNITLVSYDDHAAETVTQEEEQWYVMLKNSNGNLVGSSQAIGDLSNGQNTLIQTVDTGYRIAAPIAAVVAHHAAIYGSGQNSIIPVCVAFDLKDGSPLVTTDVANFITNSEAVIHGDVHANGSSDVIGWFEWGTSTTLGFKTSEVHVASTENINARLTGLSKNTQYYFRAAARNAAGTSYGPTLYFVTSGADSSTQAVNSYYYSSSPSPSPTPYASSIIASPTIFTASPTFVAQHTAILNAHVVTNPSVNTAVWFEWGTKADLGYATTRRNGYASSADFSDSIIGLSPDTIYYFRAVAENASGRNYGSTFVFRTLGAAEQTPVSVSAYGESSYSSGNVSRDSSVVSARNQTEFLNLAISPSDEMLPAGKIIPFVVTFENRTQRQLQNTVLIVTLPPDLTYQKLSGFSAITEKNAALDSNMQVITFSIGTIAAGDKESVTVEALLKQDTIDRKIFTTKAQLTYTDVAHQTGGKETAFAINTVNASTGSAGLVFAAGFWVWFLWGLLGLILLLFIIFLFKRRKDQEDKQGNKK